MKIYESDVIKKRFGKLNIDVIYSKQEDSLFYIFPLIENIVREICLLTPSYCIKDFYSDSDKTLTSIMENYELPKDIKELLNKYFKDANSDKITFRNKFFNPSEEFKDDINYDELINLVEKMLVEYEKKYKSKI